MPCIKQIFTSLLIVLFSLTGFSQDGIFYENTYAGETSICAWKSTLLLESPGRGSRQVGTVLFTEELQHLGKEAFVRGENHNYIWVKTKDGNTGWVEESFVVRNGGVVVIMESAVIYDKPATLSSRTNSFFGAGEIAILSDFREGWIRLTSQYKERNGWIEGYNRISVEDADIETASLLANAMENRNASDRRSALRKISETRGRISPGMAAILDAAINGTYATTLTSPGQVPATQPAATQPAATPQARPLNTPDPWQGGEDVFVDDGTTGGPNVTRDNSQTGLVIKEVIDMQTGRSYQRVYETGSIQPVVNKKAKNIYYAYHKTLPIGSMVLLQVPGTDYTIQLEIIARLRENNPNVIGLGPEVIEKVFGVSQAKNAPAATISYPKGGSL
ncbi:MAG: hypothetical protein R3D00_27650 [Bacteroidia bacterium]